MQGPDTNLESIAAIREAMRQAEPCQVTMINYRKDGTAFNNLIALKPLIEASGLMAFMVAVNAEVSDSFDDMKPKLLQMDRLLKMIPDRLKLTAPPR